MDEQATLAVLEGETVIEAAERAGGNRPTRGKAKGAKRQESEKSEGTTETVTKVDGAYFFGKDSLTGDRARAGFHQVKAVSRMRYVHDIHAENPVVIEETHYVVLKDHRHIVLRIDADLFARIIEHPTVQSIEALYAYTSLDEKPRARQYQTTNPNGLPSAEEIKHGDSVEEELLGIKKPARRKQEDRDMVDSID